MKIQLLLLLPLLSLAGCQNSYQGKDIVKETYMHKYGVPVTQSDWKDQGQDGKIVQLRKDGVTITQTFEQGKLEGETTFTFPNSSTIDCVETYKNNELAAKRRHFPSGSPMLEEQFLDKHLTKLTKWYEDGTPSLIENYQDDILVYGEYRSLTNTIESRVQEGTGTRIERSREGELMFKDTIHGGKMVERMTYFPNGDPSSITHYEDGEIHGTRLSFLQGGLPNAAEEWVHGKREGITVVYQNGEKMAEVPFTQDRKNGIERRYRDGVELVEEIYWRNDTQHGPHILYVDDQPKTEWYHQGEIVSKILYERMNPPR